MASQPGRPAPLPSVLKLWGATVEIRVVTVYSALGKNTAMKRRTTRSYSFVLGLEPT